MISIAMLATALMLGIYLTHNRMKPKATMPPSGRPGGYSPVMAHKTVHWQAKRAVARR